MNPVYLIIVSAIFTITGIILYYQEKKSFDSRRFADIADDQLADNQEKISIKKTAFIICEKNKVIISLSFAFSIALILTLFGKSHSACIGGFAACFGVSVFALKQIEKSLILKKQRMIVQFTPLVMERLVMAVEAGLDIIPAIKSVVEIDKKVSKAIYKNPVNPVIDALDEVIMLSERGVSFDEAIKTVAKNYNNHAITHAFIHLGIAHKEGGELVVPLRELSDATQAYYQETIEEELAKLPVKATAPLVVTFAGLIIFFLASPLVQIISFATRITPGR